MADDKQIKLKGLRILAIIWLLGALCDRIWFALDHSTPGWDQAEYLTGSLNYWQALQNPQLFSSEWWTSFWLLSSKIPPLTYIIAGIFQNIFGTGEDKATLVHLLFSAILLASVYGLGVLLFSIEVGLWAAAFCQLLPGLYQVRLQFVLDFPLTAFVTLSFFCLTAWRFSYESSKNDRKNLSLKQWFWAAAFGISLGLALLTKQTAIFFLFVPILWAGIGTIKQRAWGRLAQLTASLLLSIMIFGPWYRTNWLIVLTAGKRATVDSAIAEGDPGLNTLKAWTFYWHQLPYQISWTLLLVPIVGLILYWLRQNKFLNRLKSATKEPKVAKTEDKFNSSKWLWLFVFWIGAYLLSSLNINKDTRYVVPYLPVFTLFLAYGLTCWTGRWGNPIRWGTMSLAALLMCLNLFPIGSVNLLTPVISPQAQYYADLHTQLPHTEIIEEIIQTEPYLRSTLGVLPSTGIINQHNFNYYGALQNFQVYGRQVGTRQKYAQQDARSLSWFLTKTGEQGPVPKEAQSAIVQIIEQSPDFQLQKTWNLADNSTLKLYHSKTPAIQVKPLAEPKSKVNLDQVIFPPQAPPGQPVPVTYYWSGSWEQLRSGLLLLTWKPAPELETQNSANLQSTEATHPGVETRYIASLQNTSIQNPKSKIQNPRSWLHDRAIGTGNLHPKTLPANRSASGFQVIEQTAMLPSTDLLPGNYTLEAAYLNSQTGETYNISVPSVTIKIDPTAIATPAPELDLVTQLRNLAATMPLGADALGKVFEQIGSINQYDPTQDYLRQAQLTLAARLQAEPQNRDWAYALALSKILKRDVPGAIAALERVTQIDSQNPYSYGYLAFVHLYNWHPHAADSALKSAIALNPNIQEIKILSGVAALMQGNLFKAWQILQDIKYLK